MDISEYILPVFQHPDESFFIGTSFCVGNYLITAGHVCSMPSMYYVKDGDEFHELFPQECILRIRPEEKDGIMNDIAVYHIPGLGSPLELSDEIPARGDELECYCWQNVGSISPYRVKTEFLVTGNCDYRNYFKGANPKGITHGSSGCPLLKDGKVVGMLTIGMDKVVHSSEYISRLRADGLNEDEIKSLLLLDKNTCYIQTASHIIQLLKSL